MTGAVYACGHWRRRDALAGLNPACLALLEDAFAHPLTSPTGHGPWRSGDRPRSHATQTLHAAARRGLLHRAADADGQNPRWALTAPGLAAALEILRRQKVRATLARHRASGRTPVSRRALAGEGQARSARVRVRNADVAGVSP
ncbi:hypothetical protein DFR50_1594 [Roseiarcus fermentans]|uniref:Winged helix DNA-binding protein n=1 Tax=Roseiarcus fermentans TaxID=1473586 RepID=A0A366EHY0_9HYPH|nr:hypothetical protein [Roseiarcus fermentans]RBP01059.1 hypothetical protein DFR50_1594 [Roseiarcus fermentans]